MRIVNKLTVLTIVILTVIFCLAPFSTKKPAAICNDQRPQQAAAVCVSDAEDFSLINLLTLKFM